MSLAVQSCQQLSDAPNYMVPCPLCSFLDHPELHGDIIRRPGFSEREYKPGWWRCYVGPCCVLGRALDRWYESEASLCAAWLEIVWDAAEADRPARGKVTTTLERLARKGMLPSIFTSKNSEE